MTFDLTAELPVFLAYSLELEMEAAERLRDFAALSGARGQPDLAKALDKLAAFSEKHAEEIRTIARQRNLPVSVPASDPQGDNIHPETCQFDRQAPAMSIREALEKAIAQERESANFYAEVANRTANREIRTFALAFAEEENEHARILQAWLQKLSA